MIGLLMEETLGRKSTPEVLSGRDEVERDPISQQGLFDGAVFNAGMELTIGARMRTSLSP